MKPKMLRLVFVIGLASTLLFSGCSKTNPVSSVENPQAEEDLAFAGSPLEDMGSYYVLGGDIILHKENEEHMALAREIQAADEGRMAKTSGVSIAVIPRWPNATVRYKLSGFNATETNVIKSVMATFSSVCGVKFEPSTGTYYIYKISKISSGTSRSTVGYSRTSFCKFRGPDAANWAVVAHEFMHGLGFAHEHGRPDRDSYIQVNWVNILSGYRDQFAKLPIYIAVDGRQYLYSKQHTPYDYSSITHYGAYDFSTNGRATLVPTISPTTNSRIIGRQRVLSAGDKASLVALYGPRR